MTGRTKMEVARDREREKKRRKKGGKGRERKIERREERDGGSTSRGKCGRAWIDEREGSGEGRPLWWRLKEPILS